MKYTLGRKQVVCRSLLVFVCFSAVFLGSFFTPRFLAKDCAYDFFTLIAAADSTDRDNKQDSNTKNNVIEISGIDNLASDEEIIKPVITFGDESFASGRVEISLIGANVGEIDVSYNREISPTGSYIVLQNIEKDDVYTLNVKAYDDKGESESVSKTFSVNRSGSTFSCENYGELEGKTVVNAGDILINEYCISELAEYNLILFKNSLTVKLEEGKDFKVNVTGDASKGFRYEYTVLAESFEDDADYAVRIHSVGKKNNADENTAELEQAQYDVEFSVDKISPEINILTDFESNTTYYESSKVVSFTISDNSDSISLVSVVVDGEETARWEKSEDNQKGYFPQDNIFSFLIKGSTIEPHNIAIMCVDSAGNEKIITVIKVVVTGNVFLKNGGINTLTFSLLLCVIVIISGIVILKSVRERFSVQKEKSTDDASHDNKEKTTPSVKTENSSVESKPKGVWKIVDDDSFMRGNVKLIDNNSILPSPENADENNLVQEISKVKPEKRIKSTEQKEKDTPERVNGGEKIQNSKKEKRNTAQTENINTADKKLHTGESKERSKQQSNKNSAKGGSNSKGKSNKKSSRKRKKKR